jgi:hypothetical protein
MPRFEAPSISMTSRSSPRRIASPIASLSESPASRLRARAKMRAIDVFPTPRVPQKRYAWAVRPVRMAFRRVRAIGSWPTTSPKSRER